MKTLKTTMAALSITTAILAFVSCKKESTPAPLQKTTQEMIAGKWNLASSVFNSFYAGSSHVYNYTGTAADYADFRSDGKVYSLVNGGYDTVAYAVISDTKMWIDTNSDIYDIQKLTGTELKIYRKEVINANEYDESTLNFKK